MILKEIEIHGFRSIVSDVLNIDTKQVCLVGINESGKTNYLKAIHFLNLSGVEFEKNMTSKLIANYRNAYPLVSGVFELSESDEVWIDRVVNKTESSHSKEPQKKYLQIKRWGSFPDNLSIDHIVNGNRWNIFEFVKNKLEFLDQFIQEIYPEILYFNSEDLLLEPATSEELLSDDRKFETLRRLFYVCGFSDLEIFSNTSHDELTGYIDEINENAKTIFRQHYKQDSSIEVVVNLVGEKFNVIIKDSSRKPFMISERAPGFQYYFSFLINKLYTTSFYGEKGVIYLLDEPGVNLHPKGARNLLTTFKEVASKNQLLYTTHNPFLTIRDSPLGLKYISRDGKKGSKVYKKPWKGNYQVIRKELGILLNDSFLLGDINLVVEGSTEKCILHRIFQDDLSGELEWLNIYDAESASKIPQVVNYLGINCLNLSGIILVDSDSAGEKNMINPSIKKNIETNKWRLLNINSVFTTKEERTFEDLFSVDIYLNAYNTYCNRYKDSLEIKEFETLESKDVKCPIISSISNHFDAQKKIDNSEVTFASNVVKLEIAMIALESVYELEEIDRNDALKNFHKLSDLIREKAKEIIRHANH